MSGSRNILWLLPLLLAATSSFWADSVRHFLVPAPPTVPSVATAGERSEQGFTMRGVVFFQQEEGNGRWEIHAARLFSSGDEQVVCFEQVEAGFTGDSGGARFRITGGEASYDRRDRVLRLAKDVMVASAKDGFAVRSSALDYDERSGAISASAGFSAEGHGLRLSGRTMRYNMRTGAYVASGDVRFEAL